MSVIDKDYWDNWYKKFKNSDPSPFAVFCESEYFLPFSKITDVGCGNGRDSMYFSSKGHFVTSIDSADCDIPSFTRCDACEFDYNTDVIYSRWFLHALDDKSESIFLEKACKGLNNNGLLCVECRSSKEDNPPTNDHFRRLIDKDALKAKIRNLGLIITFSGEKRGWSKVGDDDPLLIRIIARK